MYGIEVIRDAAPAEDYIVVCWLTGVEDDRGFIHVRNVDGEDLLSGQAALIGGLDTDAVVALDLVIERGCRLI
jgi:hypothetical protein